MKTPLKTLKIGIDCRLWDETGIGRYIRNIVQNLAEIEDIQNEYILFVLLKDIPQIQNANLGSAFKLVPANIRWYTFAEQLLFPLILYKQKLDILWVPNLNVPIFYLKKFVVTIHDLTVLKIKTGRASTRLYPFYLAKRLAVYLPLLSAVHKAKAIFTVSQFVKQDLIKTFKANSNKIYLTPNAVDPKFTVEPPEKVANALKRYKITKPYIFYVGNAHPHKNLERLISAFVKVKAEYPDLSLILGGNKKFFYERLEAEWANYSIFDSLNFIGFVADDDLSALYTGAEAFVNPSLYEGFGIQLLEAFACGTKVICSNATSLPEIGGDIPYYFDPTNVADMANVIIQGLRQNDVHRVQKGFDRVKDFSWRDSAKVVFARLVD